MGNALDSLAQSGAGGFLPLLPRGRRERVEEARVARTPLSPALSPLVPRGERGKTTAVASYCWPGVVQANGVHGTVVVIHVPRFMAPSVISPAPHSSEQKGPKAAGQQDRRTQRQRQPGHPLEPIASGLRPLRGEPQRCDAFARDRRGRDASRCQLSTFPALVKAAR